MVNLDCYVFITIILTDLWYPVPLWYSSIDKKFRMNDTHGIVIDVNDETDEYMYVRIT